MPTTREVNRCPWPGSDPLYQRYHDEEWGVPRRDEAGHFEFLILEGAQAGLSWLTILRRRENYRRVFAKFNPKKVAAFTQEHVEKILQDPSIIRNRLKVEGAVHNARLFLEVADKHQGFANFLWSFVDGKPVQNSWRDLSEVPATTTLSDQVSRELKRLGFKFTGSTIVYSHLQATGLVNDHLTSCFRYRQIKALAKGR
jgi:DNA-3-methyladenine glycosylase I